MDHEVWVFSPISWTAILIIIGLPILCVFAGLDALFDFIHNHINIIAIVGIIVALGFSFIAIFVSKKPFYLLTILTNTFSLSQFLYMLVNGSQAIYMMETMYLAGLWRLIVFLIWLVYLFLNLAVCIFGMGLAPYCVFDNRASKTNDDFYGTLSTIICAIAGVVGWVINLIFL